MARRVLRGASLALAGGGATGILLGGVYAWYGLQGWNRPGLSGLLAGWAVVVWIASAGVIALASWTWRTTFKNAAVVLTLAGLEALYLAAQYLGHDFTPWPSIAFGAVSALVLTPTAAACVLFRRETGSSSGRSSDIRER
jgi:hypothetical protein